MTLMMPIKPEPAQRIYSGIKKFELRKSIPPETSIISKGYDNGGDLPGFCSPQESNSVERQIELNY